MSEFPPGALLSSLITFHSSLFRIHMTTPHFQHELPDLRILPIDHLLLHEEHDAQRSQPLGARLAADGVLRNPPVVAPLPGEDRFVVLDGANRVTALAVLNIPHIL